VRTRRAATNPQRSASAATIDTPTKVAAPLDLDGWQDVLTVIRGKRPALAAVLDHAALLCFGPERVELGYGTGSVLVGQVIDASTRDLLLSVLTTHFGRTPELAVETISAASDHATLAAGTDHADSLRASLQRARRVAPELASATDAVNIALERVEQALTTLNLGVTACIDLDPDRNPRDDWARCLRFGKDGSTWRLLLESGPEGGDADDWSQSPLLSASKEVRLQAVEQLPALIDKLVEAAEDQVGRFRAAAAKAQAVAAAIAEAK
jgi:DNA polymerase-3 subunit gamma/tau